MRASWMVLCSVAIVAASAMVAVPDAPAPASPTVKSTMGGSGPMIDEMDDQTRSAIKRGLEWLSKNMNIQNQGRTYGGQTIAIPAMMGIAFMADGSTPDQGPYAKQVSDILDMILANTRESGLIATDGDGGPMYGHGFATLFLAEVYGMTGRKDVKEKLQLALRLTVRTQNPEGGWQYQAIPATADTSATICQVMALRAARNAGITIPKVTIDNAVKYTLNSLNPDGGVRYMLTGGSPQSGWARTAACSVSLNYMGIYDSKELKSMKSYLMKQMPGPAQADNGDPGAIAGCMYYYGNYYMCQAMFMLGGDAWSTYWPLIKADLLKKQQTNGNWAGEINENYSTALALIILQVPYRLLPILQR